MLASNNVCICLVTFYEEVNKEFTGIGGSQEQCHNRKLVLCILVRKSLVISIISITILVGLISLHCFADQFLSPICHDRQGGMLCTLPSNGLVVV